MNKLIFGLCLVGFSWLMITTTIYLIDINDNLGFILLGATMIILPMGLILIFVEFVKTTKKVHERQS